MTSMQTDKSHLKADFELELKHQEKINSEIWDSSLITKCQANMHHK